MRLKRSRPEHLPGPPDFIGVGAEGSAGGWWLAALTAHPQLRGPQRGGPALHFFDRFCAEEPTDADVVEYHAHFPRRPATPVPAGAAGRVLRGEWTGRYMCDGWTPPLLRRAAPDARLLVMVSDPIQRFRAVFAERKAAAEAEGKRMRTTDVVDRACYAFQLARLRRYFEPARILVLQQERCLLDPAAEYRRTLRFLGVREDFVPVGLRPSSALGRLRRIPPVPRAQPAAPLWPELEGALHATLEPDVAALRALAPELDLSLWPDFAQPAAGGAGAGQTSSSVTAS